MNDELTNKIANLKGYVRFNERDHYDNKNRWVWAIQVVDSEFPNCQAFKPVYATHWEHRLESALELFEELRQNFFRVTLMCWDHMPSHYVVTCDYRQGHNEDIKPIEASGETIQIAICRAWIAWKERTP
jgi:hypothetical protein